MSIKLTIFSKLLATIASRQKLSLGDIGNYSQYMSNFSYLCAQYKY